MVEATKTTPSDKRAAMETLTNLGQNKTDVSKFTDMEHDFSAFQYMDVDALVDKYFPESRQQDQPEDDPMDGRQVQRNSLWAEDSDENPCNDYAVEKITPDPLETNKDPETVPSKDSETVPTKDPETIPNPLPPGGAGAGLDFLPLPPPALGAGTFALDEEPGSSEPKKSRMDYGKAANKARNKPFAVLYVHSGQDTRALINEDLWTQVFQDFNQRTALAVMAGNLDHEFRIEPSHWREGRGVIVCSNEKTVAIVVKMVRDININGQNFRVWPANEHLHLVTLILPPGSEIFGDNIWPLFLAQNGIDGGQHGTPKVVPLNKGTLKIFVGLSKILAAKIRSLGGRGALGGYTVTANVSK